MPTAAKPASAHRSRLASLTLPRKPQPADKPAGSPADLLRRLRRAGMSICPAVEHTSEARKASVGACRSGPFRLLSMVTQ